MKSNCYESGEKAGKCLAGQLKQKEANYIIPAITDEKGILNTGTKDFKKVFLSFYKKLYKSEIKHYIYKCKDVFFSSSTYLNLMRISKPT